MNAYQFCSENANETLSGRIVFSLPVVKKFIKIYTNLEFDDFSTEMLKRLRLTMIDYSYEGFSKSNRVDQPAEKIELPQFIFR